MSVVPVMVVTLLLSCTSAPWQTTYDGRTWRGWPQSEREEFVNGYIAYLLCEGQDQAFKGRLVYYERELSAHIDSVLAANSAEVADLLRLVAPRVRPAPAGGERYDNKYGIFLGHYWVPMEEQLRRRFLQGYLYAQRRNPKSTERYSRTVEEYERLVDAEFRKPDSDLERGIGEVLSLFRDK